MSESDSNFGDYFQMWYYRPSLPAAIIAVIVFTALTGFHLFRLITTRTWFCIPFIVGGLFEIIGYAARIACHDHMDSTPPYVVQSLLLLIAPPLFAASIYMILGRIIRATGAEHYCIIRVNFVTKIFVCGDVACFLVQAAGGGIQAQGGYDSFKTGEDIVLAGLILQIVVFLFFLVVAGKFHQRLLRQPTAKSIESGLPWQRKMWILYTVSALITIRNLVRVIEYAMGAGGYLLTHEWTLYVFDGLLMALTLLICTTWYDGDIKPRKKSVDDVSLEEQSQQPQK